MFIIVCKATKNVVNLTSVVVSQNDFTDRQVERGSYFYVFPVAFDKIDGMS